MKRGPFVFFDLGGTLVDLRGIVASMAAQLQASRVRGPVPLALEWAISTANLLPTAQGRKFRPEREIAADVLCALLEKRGRPDTREESTRLVVDAWDGFVKISSLHSDASVEWLRVLRSDVAGLGIVTDGDVDAVHALLSHLNLSGLFDSVTASESVRSYKPDSGIYRAALRALRAKPAEALFVSDASLDLQGAASLGIAGAWMPRGLLPDAANLPPHTATLSNLREVEGLVKRFHRWRRFASR
jgi:2-haloalkanoic acid dehalogenase type II